MDVLCEKDDCEKEATTRYVWPWGDEGFLCDDHRGHTQQLADQLGRVVAFTPLGPPRPPPEPPTPASELMEQLAQLQHRYETLEEAFSNAQLENVRLSNELGAIKRLRAVRGGHVDSDVEPAATASTDPAVSPSETQSPPKAPRQSR